MARRKAQTYGSAILADRGGRLSARHMRRAQRTKRQRMLICGDLTDGRAALSLGGYPPCAHAGPKAGSAKMKQPQRAMGLERPGTPPSRSTSPEGDSAMDKSSASSWQGLLVDPGGAPAPPERLVERRPDPQGTAPRPAFRALRDSAPSTDEVDGV
jgi:hypothetical protein